MNRNAMSLALRLAKRCFDITSKSAPLIAAIDAPIDARVGAPVRWIGEKTPLVILEGVNLFVLD
jgi:hypothetical protein